MNPSHRRVVPALAFVAGSYTIKRDGADAGASVLVGTMAPAP